MNSYEKIYNLLTERGGLAKATKAAEVNPTPGNLARLKDKQERSLKRKTTRTMGQDAYDAGLRGRESEEVKVKNVVTTRKKPLHGLEKAQGEEHAHDEGWKEYFRRGGDLTGGEKDEKVRASMKALRDRGKRKGHTHQSDKPLTKGQRRAMTRSHGQPSQDPRLTPASLASWKRAGGKGFSTDPPKTKWSKYIDPETGKYPKKEG
jgi:hypothetical protein